MAPAAAASILAASSRAAAASSKRPAASDAEQLLLPDSSSALPPQVDDDDEAARGSKSQKQQTLECPRCRSTNTKFCYYNNYSTMQPRHFCRACRRYWTHGGTLRDVPVGGATRRANRRRLSVSAEPPPRTTTQEPGLSSTTAFPFLGDGSYYLPQLDLGFLAPEAFSSRPSVVPDFYNGLAPWDDGTLGGGGAVTGGAWGDDIASQELSWPTPGYWY